MSNICDVWVSLGTREDHSTWQDEVDMIPSLVDLGRRLDLFERETFCPHVWCRQHDAIIDFPKEAIAGTIRLASGNVDM